MMIKQWMEWGLFGEFYFQAKPDITFYVSCHGGSNINIYVYIYIAICVYIYISFPAITEYAKVEFRRQIYLQ